MKLLRIFIITFPLSFSSAAENLETYVQSIIKNSPLIETNRLKIEELKQLHKIEGLPENPNLGIEYGRVKNTGISGSQVGFSIQQSLNINGAKKINQNSIQEEIKQQKIQNSWQMQQFKNEITNYLIALWVERKKISHAKHRINNLKILRTYLSSRKFSTPQQKSDAYLIRKKIEEVEHQLNASVHLEMQIHSLLKEMNGNDINHFDILLKDQNLLIKFFQDFTSSYEKIVEIRNSKRRQLKLLSQNAQRKWIPDLNLGYSYQKENVPGGNLGHAVGINFSIPLFNSGKAETLQIQSKLQRQESLWQYEDLKKRSELASLKERLTYFSTLASHSLKLKEQDHRQELKNVRDYFLKGLINAQTYLETEDLGHNQYHRYLNSHREVIQVFLDATLLTGNSVSLKEVLK